MAPIPTNRLVIPTNELEWADRVLKNGTNSYFGVLSPSSYCWSIFIAYRKANGRLPGSIWLKGMDDEEWKYNFVLITENSHPKFRYVASYQPDINTETYNKAAVGTAIFIGYN